MARISPRADAVMHSGIREIVDLVIDADGPVARLEIGEPGFPTPAHIVEAGVAAARAGARYTASAGTRVLREAIGAKLGSLHGLSIPTDRVVVCQGAVQGCSATLAALLAPGDEVLIPDPAWPNYEMLVTLHGGVPVRYPLPADAGFVPDPADVDRLVTDRTVALVLNSPGNPTGAVFPATVVEALVAVAQRHDLVVLSDEVYEELIFAGEPANALALDPERVVGLYSFSKTYAMTGWRVGYAALPAWLAPTVAKLQEPLLSCISAVSQAAAVAALEGPQESVAAMRDAYRDRRDLVVDLLARGGIAVAPPAGAFYLMLPLAPGTDSRRAALDLVDHGVSVAPGTAFGVAAADHVRLSLAGEPAVLRDGVARLLDWYGATGGGAAPGTPQHAGTRVGG